MGLLLFFAALSAGSALGAALWGRKYEELLPVTGMTLVLLLFLCGLIGLLGPGVLLALLLCAAAWLAALAHALRKKRLAAAARAFFTPNFFLFCCLFVYFWLLNHGRLAYSFDELSHWADVVKAMCQIDALSTSPLSNSTFQSYPPGISLFQYFEQKLTILCGGGFTEGLLYHGFQVFLVSLILPFLKDLDYRRLYAWPVAAALLLSPGFLFETVYLNLLVDPLLGLLSAAGLAAILLTERRDGLYRAFVLLCAAMLVLVKPAGLMLALFLAAAYVLAELPDRKKTLTAALCALAAVLLPWALWQLSIRLNAAAVAFPDRVSLPLLLRVLLGRDDSYRKTVRDLFLTGLIEIESSASFLGVTPSHPLLFAALPAALLWAGRQLCRRESGKRRLFRRIWLLLLAELLVYLFGLLVTYLFKFGEYEAIRLASFARYLAIPLLSWWMLTLFITVSLFRDARFDRSLAAAALLVLILACTPNKVLLSLSNREAVGRSRETRAPFTQLYEGFAAAYDGEPARMYLISQEDTEFEYFLTKFSFRPNAVTAPLGWTLGQPFYEGDIWTRDVSAEQLRETLQADYDFLILRRCNDSFRVRFGSLFAEPAHITENSVYRVDPASGLLVWYAGA